MADRSEDWMRQAEADLEHAELSARGGDFEWACFAAHQAAEKALKALFLSRHGEVWGHSLLAMLRKLPVPSAAAVTDTLLEAAKALDKHYVPTRYPNGFDAGAPTDYYTQKDAREGIAHAQAILGFCRDQIRRR